MKKLYIIVFALFTLTACQSGGTDVPAAAPTSAGATEISMESGNLFFSPDNLSLTKGEPVKLTFQNAGTHTFTIDELGIDVPIRGSSAVVEFTPNQTGTFEYYCATPGHRSGGMFGSLTVE